ncbi:sulfotransferase domain-containing protein [Thalassospira sp. MA62]|nr:sulfotransferase domain-containing protein [Thalassospira sp. MA62]
MATKFKKMKTASEAICQGIRKYLRNRPYQLTAPASPRIDDTFLVEFPKSGITWLTFLIASVNLQKSGIPRKPTFFAINDIVPDIHRSRHLPPPLPFPGHRFVKSHAPHNDLYSKVIYLVRDPRDVMVSYHVFATKLGWYNGSLHDFIRDPIFGIDAWVSHAQSWLTQTQPSVSFSVIRYEDLIEDPAGVLEKIYALLGFSIEKAILQTAVKDAAFDRMQENEVFCAKDNLSLPKNFTFVRKGGSSHKDELSDTDRRFIEDRAGDTMKIFDYS